MVNDLNQNDNLNQINNNIISIDDCFLYNKRDRTNRNYCNLCKQEFDSINNASIYASPNVLVLILNREKGNINEIKLNFTETIDITDYVIIKDRPRIFYNLYGVITYIDQNGPHFIASCKSHIDNRWYRYNDSLVTPINNLRSDVFDYGNPYVLFYEKY